jgi:peroxiredoxin
VTQSYETLPADLPAPRDDGGAAHLRGARLPHVALPSTNGGALDVGALKGLAVLYFYPRTGKPGVALPEGWDMIPGARGCTPQSCAFRDHFAELNALGVSHIFGVSTQDTPYQLELAQRTHLPFPLLSDAEQKLAKAMNLPMMQVGDMILNKRLTLIVRDGVIERVFYPVFPPDRNAADVAAALSE